MVTIRRFEKIYPTIPELFGDPYLIWIIDVVLIYGIVQCLLIPASISQDHLALMMEVLGTMPRKVSLFSCSLDLQLRILILGLSSKQNCNAADLSFICRLHWVDDIQGISSIGMET